MNAVTTSAGITMELTISHENGYVHARAKGAVDESAGPLFRELLHPLVGEPGTRVVLDLSAADRINSLGISHLVRLVSDANTNGSRVVLSGAKPFVASVLTVTRLDRFFEMAADLPGALALFPAAKPA